MAEEPVPCDVRLRIFEIRNVISSLCSERKQPVIRSVKRRSYPREVCMVNTQTSSNQYPTELVTHAGKRFCPRVAPMKSGFCPPEREGPIKDQG